ncbi:MAG: YdeI family protein [bacterium]
MRISEKLHVTKRADWRAWLSKNHESKKEVWLIFCKKYTGKPRIPYDDAVEEALCFGWIDSTIRRLDDEKFVRKFTPRRGKSNWSELNKKRARKMIRQGRMTRTGLTKFREIENNKKASKAKPSKKRLVVPPDLRKALATNKKAWENFRKFAPSYRRLYVGWITDAKRRQTREKRIEQTVRWAAQNKKPGMM